MGLPSEIYSYGSGIMFMEIGIVVSYLICYFTFVPLMHPLEVTSIYQYLHLRYDSQLVRMFSTVIGACQTTLYLSIALLSPALALQAAGGTPMWLSVLVVGAIGTIYTVIGGIKSVIWTDVFQTCIFFIGLISALIKGVQEVGGISQAWSLAEDGGRISFNKFSPDPRVRLTFWGGTIGGILSWLTTSYSQATLQRIRSLRTLKQAKISFLLNIPFFVLYAILVMLMGIVVYAFFSHARCDPLKANLIANRNQLVPFFVYHVMTDVMGMGGLFMATLFCGTLSTVSSGINSLAAITVEDILERPLRNVSERTATIVTKICAACYGIVICCLGYSAQYLDGPVSQLAISIFGAFGIPIFGMFLIGSAVPWANKYGAMVGGLVSLVFNLWINIGSQILGRKPSTLPSTEIDNCESFNLTMTITKELYYHDDMSTVSHEYLKSHNNINITLYEVSDAQTGVFSVYDISYEWFVVYGMLVSLLVGLSVSYCTRSKNWRLSLSNSKLIFPICRRLWSLQAMEDLNDLSSIENLSKVNLRMA